MRIICVKNNFVIKFLYARKFKVLQCWENSYNLVDFQIMSIIAITSIQQWFRTKNFEIKVEICIDK